MTTTASARSTTESSRRRGRELESAIFEATFEELALGGFESLTLERVTNRAKAGKASVYRRWRTPGDLVIDALGYIGEVLLPPPRPTTGDLRTDLVIVLKELAVVLGTTHGRAICRLITQREQNPELHARVFELIVSPRRDLLAELFAAAADRGQIAASVITPVLVASAPRLVLAQHLADGNVTESDCEAIVDDVVLPAAVA